MPDSVHTEYARDDAKNRLDKIERAEGECQEAVRAALRTLQAACACSDADFRYALDCAEEAMADMTFDARSALESEISRMDDEISTADWSDLNRSRPVVL